jgi:hypothetical protein
MRMPGRVGFHRTCKDCGYSWHVPRAFARRKVTPVSAANVAGSSRGSAAGRAGLHPEIQSSMAIRSQAEAFRRCPNCGSGDYSQHRVRS